MLTSNAVLNKFKLVEERYVNLFDSSEKQPYADRVFKLLQDSYASIGGIKGGGFNSVDDMINNIPFWKLNVDKDGVVKCVVLYKDKDGRKCVALATDGTRKSINILTNIMKAELSRSYVELSDSPWKMLKKIVDVSTILKYVIPFKDAYVLTNGTITKSSNAPHDEFTEYYYDRSIGGSTHTKIMLGTIGKSIER